MEIRPGTKFSNHDEYIAVFPDNIQALLQDIRKTIQQAAPGTTEVISYNMPAFKQNSVLVWYAGYKGHIGFYPSTSPILVFKDELAKYKTSKGAIQFPIDKPIPKALVKKIVKYRLQEDNEKANLKGNKKK